MRTESALLFGLPASEEALALDLGTPRRAGWGKIEVPLTVTIPARSIVLLPVGEEELGARLELRVAVMDKRGNRSDIPNIPIEVRRRDPARDGDAIVYETWLKMRNTSHNLVVSVYDVASGEVISAIAELVL